MFLNEFGYDAVIADRNLELNLAADIWNNRPHIIWLDEYLASKTEDKAITTYTFEEAPFKKFNNFKIARLSFSYLANVDKEYPDNLPFLANKGAKVPLEGYKQVKCYQTICVYEKAI
ncbi:MAG: hypothetical protein QME12_04570 [Nanoarchaeota archaeon]|nr:hypothetical protein [Nanoarchaeota archaeon]